MKNKNIIILVLVLAFSGCATRSILDLGNEKYSATANCANRFDGLECAVENAKQLAAEQCGAKKVIVENVSHRNDSQNFPETTLTFYCK